MDIRLTLLPRTLGVVALLATSALASVTNLGTSTSYATIQAAVDAAVDGDVLLVDPGTYAGFTITNKALSVIALPGSNVNVNTQVVVQNVSGGRTVLLSGLKVTAQGLVSSFMPGYPGLVLANDAGHVRLQGCTFKGGTLYMPDPFQDPLPAGHGVKATDCARVIFTQCTLTGREAGFVAGEGMRPGGDGLNSTNSAIALYDCTLKGGEGTSESWPTGGKGGAGCVVNDYGIFVSGSTITGGRGGGGDYIGCSISGDGGVGLILNDSQVHVLDTVVAGGLEGSYYTCTPGNPGAAIEDNSGALVQHAGTRRKLSGPAITNDNATVPLVLSGEEGDSFWLVRARRPDFHFMLSLNGIYAVPYPWLVPIAPMGTVGVGGTLNVNLPIGDLSASQLWFMQGVCVDSAGESFLTSPLQLLVVNP